MKPLDKIKKTIELIGYEIAAETKKNDETFIYVQKLNSPFELFDPRNNPRQGLDLVKYVMRIEGVDIMPLKKPDAYHISSFVHGIDVEETELEIAALSFLMEYIGAKD